MITRSDLNAIVRAITAPRAAELANITYRQLDYWARQGWVKPSVEPGTGRPGRRLYAAADVVKLAALGHFGRAGADVGRLGPEIARVGLPGGAEDYLLLTSPAGGVEVVPAEELRDRVCRSGGGYLVYDPAPLRTVLADGGRTAEAGAPGRRSA